MKEAGFRIVPLVLALTLFAATSHAIIEEKSSVVGTLLSGSDQPFVGVSIRLLDSIFLKEVARTITDPSGKFVLSNILPGLYLIAFQTSNTPAVMKRIQVVSGSPTLIDVRSVLDEQSLKNHNAWDSLKWIIRTAERNPLHEDQSVIDSASTLAPSPGFLAALRSFQNTNNINGQVSYVNIGAGFSDPSVGHQSAQIAVRGDWERDASWSFNGNVLEGPRASYSATGDFRYNLSDHQIGTSFSANDLMFATYPDLLNRQRITKFIHSPAPDDIPDQAKTWITSVDLQDQWRVIPKVSVNYGARIDYYGYLENSVNCSPRVEVSVQPMPEFAIRGVVYRNLTAPGNYYFHTPDTSSFEHNVAFVPYTGALQSERTTGYEFGFDGATENLQLSMYYHTEEIADKIATLDLSDSPVHVQLDSIHPFVIFNSTDLKSHGIRVNATKKINARISARASYDVRQSLPMYIIEKRVYSERQLYFLEGGSPQFFHDVMAGVEARFEPTGTSVNAGWKWSSGSPLVFGRKEDNKALTAIDVEVRQGLPVRVFSQSQSDLQVLVAIKNILDQNREITSNADFQRALIFGMPRTISGGVLLKF